jgi:hypothetical protein
MSARSVRRGVVELAAVAAVALVSFVALGGCSQGSERADRQATVARRGAEVMPFDLDATTHRFTKTDDGGVQVVTADDPEDTTQIGLIRQHLQRERDNFASGNFDDPARIHGMDMPGVSELAAGYARITVTYAERADGAALTYATEDPTLVEAIHSWFDRQVMDHGDHAAAG